jgi:glycosyltransferase involved in cell wall biosynthesis
VTGILVDDSRELADRLEELLDDDVLRVEMGRKAQSRIAEFSWQQSAAAMCRVLAAVRSGRRVSGLC